MFLTFVVERYLPVVEALDEQHDFQPFAVASIDEHDYLVYEQRQA